MPYDVHPLGLLFTVLSNVQESNGEDFALYVKSKRGRKADFLEFRAANGKGSCLSFFLPTLLYISSLFQIFLIYYFSHFILFFSSDGVTLPLSRFFHNFLSLFSSISVPPLIRHFQFSSSPFYFFIIFLLFSISLIYLKGIFSLLFYFFIYDFNDRFFIISIS